MILIKSILSISKEVDFKFELYNGIFIQIPFIALTISIERTNNGK